MIASLSKNQIPDKKKKVLSNISYFHLGERGYQCKRVFFLPNNATEKTQQSDQVFILTSEL